MSIASAGNRAPWDAFQQAVKNLRQLVHNTLGGNNRYVEPEPNRSRDIFMQRRVFSKVRVYAYMSFVTLIYWSRQVDIASSDYGNTEIDGQSVPSGWSASDRLQIGRRTDTGAIVACSDAVLSAGDFVDVAVVFDIRNTRTFGENRKLKVHLGLAHIVQLMRSIDVDKASGIFLCWP